MSAFFTNKTILLPFDFSDQATAAVDEALQMAEDSTSIRMLNVVVPIQTLALEPEMAVDLGDDTVRLDDAKEKMEEKFGSRSHEIKCETRLGDPGHEIVDFAKEINADLIIMPSHGRTGISRLLLGSVAERVMRHADCPVMVLREPKA